LKILDTVTIPTAVIVSESISKILIASVMMNHVSCCFDQFVSLCFSMKRFFHVDCKSAVAQFEFKEVQGRCCLMIERLAGDTSLSIPQVN
jgi:hypothetical protein